MFLRLEGEPMPVSELAAYCDRLNDLLRNGARIKEVHAYTIARPTPEEFATKLDKEELGRVAATIRDRTGLNVSTFE
jgi:hypothetical protein